MRTTDIHPGPRRQRRWFQYSLRTLLVLTVLASVGMSWFAVKLKGARQQREAVEAILRIDGKVEYDYQVPKRDDPFPDAGPPGPLWLRNLFGQDMFATVVGVYFSPSLVDDGLEVVRPLTQIKKLFLTAAQVTDAGLQHLNGNVELQTLCLMSTRVSDAGMKHLEGLTQLQELFLGNTRVTDAGLERLKRLTRLRKVYLGVTKVTDKGMEHFEGLTQLRELILHDTRVTDAGLLHLRGLAQLRMLDLRNTKVTDGGVKRLQESLPNCEIRR